MILISTHVLAYKDRNAQIKTQLQVKLIVTILNRNVNVTIESEKLPGKVGLECVKIENIFVTSCSNSIFVNLIKEISTYIGGY